LSRPSNRDNHARNTALQRDFKGHIALAPVFDFAPMYLHPDGIARRIRWDANDSGAPDWKRVIDSVCASCQLPRAPLVAGLKTMAPRLREIESKGANFGLEPEVHEFLVPAIAAQARALEALR
jgi:serine/threonine-protein kinase HipA